MFPESGPRKPRGVRPALDRHALPALLAVATNRQQPPPLLLRPTDDGEQARSASHLRAAVRQRPSTKTTKPQPHNVHKSPRAPLLLTPLQVPSQHQHQRTTRIEETHSSSTTVATNNNNAEHEPGLEEMWRVAASSAAATQQQQQQQRQRQKEAKSSVVVQKPHKSVGNQGDDDEQQQQQPTNGTTLARYRRLVGTHARKTLLLIKQHAAARVAKHRLEHTCAVRIQRVVRRFLGRCRRSWLALERRRAAQRIQQHWRRTLVRRKVAIERQERQLRERQREEEETQRRMAAQEVQQRYRAFAEAKRAKQSQCVVRKEKLHTVSDRTDDQQQTQEPQQRTTTLEIRRAVARGVVQRFVSCWCLRRRRRRTNGDEQTTRGGAVDATKRPLLCGELGDPVVLLELTTVTTDGDGDEIQTVIQETSSTPTTTCGTAAASTSAHGVDHDVTHGFNASRPSSGGASRDTPATTLVAATNPPEHRNKSLLTGSESQESATDPTALVVEPSAMVYTQSDDTHVSSLDVDRSEQHRYTALSTRGDPLSEELQAPLGMLSACTQSAWCPVASTAVPPRDDLLASASTPVACLVVQHHHHHSHARAVISRFLCTHSLPHARHQLAQRYNAAIRIQQLLRQRLARRDVAFHRQLCLVSLRSELQSHWLHTDSRLINSLFSMNNASVETHIGAPATNSYARDSNDVDNDEEEDDEEEEEIFDDLEEDGDSASSSGGVCWAEILPTRNGNFPSGLAVEMSRTTSSYSGRSGPSLPLWKWSWTSEHWEPNRALLTQITNHHHQSKPLG